MSADIMALYGPGSHIDGYPRHGRNTPPPGARERMEHGLERIHRLWTSALARYIDLLDAEVPDADLEPSLAGFGGQAGSGDDREGDYGHGRTSDDEPYQAWTEGQSRCGRFGAGFALEDDEHSLGSLQGTSALFVLAHPHLRHVIVWRQAGASQVHWAAGASNDREPDADFEPSLCGTIWTAGTSGNDDDREGDCEDEGAQDDREPDEHEATLGWSEAESLRGSTGNSAGCDEEEEASLGSLGGTATSGGSQLAWSDGEGFDKEEEHDGREPEHEGLNGDELDYSQGAEGEYFGFAHGHRIVSVLA